MKGFFLNIEEERPGTFTDDLWALACSGPSGHQVGAV
jgi:hypothetical protein